MAERKINIPTGLTAALLLVLVAGLGLSACTKNSERIFFNGEFYPAKAKRDKNVKQGFVVTVRRANRGIEGAREAGRYEGTRYCVQNFGTSEVDWTRGPDGEGGALAVKGSSLVLTGSCVTW